MAFTVPKELRDDWMWLQKQRKHIQEFGTANSDINVVALHAVLKKFGIDWDTWLYGK